MDDKFYFAGTDTTEIAKKYGTPVYVMDEDLIRKRINTIKEKFLDKYENTYAYYASKAFLCNYMIEILKDEDFGIDVVSYCELMIALKNGMEPSKIMMHGNNKSTEELKLAIKSGVGRIVVDSLSELVLLREILTESEKKVAVLFRLSPAVAGDTHKYITTGQLDSKFGIPIGSKELEEALNIAIKSECIDFKGIHFHIGSQLFSNSPYVEATEKVFEIIDWIKQEYDYHVEELNIGGGFGIKYTSMDEPLDIEYFLDPIMELVEKKSREISISRPVVYIEPGRYIVGEAGITLYEVGSIKNIEGVRKYISIDGGMPDNPRPALYQAKYDAVVANKYNSKDQELVTVAGKCCESGDILIWDIMLPKAERGDILCVKSTGAYNFSMASNYNKLLRPPVVMVKEGVDKLVVKRQTCDDLF